MPDGNPPQPPTPRVLPNLVSEAQAGHVNVKMSLEDFVNLDRDCEHFLTVIGQIMRIADGVSRQENWGLGEHTDIDGQELVSGKTLVKRFREKSRGSSDTTDNSVYAIMAGYQQAVTDVRDTYTAIRKQLTDHDDREAARYKSLESTLPKQAPVTPPKWEPYCHM